MSDRATRGRYDSLLSKLVESSSLCRIAAGNAPSLGSASHRMLDL